MFSYWFAIIFIQSMTNCFEISHHNLTAINMTDGTHHNHKTDVLDNVGIDHKPQLYKSQDINNGSSTTEKKPESVSAITEKSKIQTSETHMNETSELDGTLHLLLPSLPILMKMVQSEHVYSGLLDDPYFEDHRHCNQSNINLNEFTEQIPPVEIQELVQEFYTKDTEVQIACTFLLSKEFVDLRNALIGCPEMQELSAYLNNSEFDVLDVMSNLTDLYSIEPEALIKNSKTQTVLKNGGIAALVGKILLKAPQNKMISAFFYKLDSESRFGKLIRTLGSDECSLHLNKVERSVPFKNLMTAVNKNGINIVSILKTIRNHYYIGI